MTKERHALTDQVKQHNHNDGLFRTAEQADKRQVASEVTDGRPRTRPSRNLFRHAVDCEAAEPQRPTTQRDDAAMRSLRFPFDQDDGK